MSRLAFLLCQPMVPIIGCLWIIVSQKPSPSSCPWGNFWTLTLILLVFPGQANNLYTCNTWTFLSPLWCGESILLNNPINLASFLKRMCQNRGNMQKNRLKFCHFGENCKICRLNQLNSHSMMAMLDSVTLCEMWLSFARQVWWWWSLRSEGK